MNPIRHPIAVAARRSGLSPHVIRKWEQRYGAITPARSAGNLRLYSDSDIERLRLLQLVVRSGYSIGQIAHLAMEQLRECLSPDVLWEEAPAGPPAGAEQERLAGPLRSGLQALLRLDAAGLRRELELAELSLGQNALLETLIPELMREVGRQWRERDLRIAHEHLASGVVRTYLGEALKRAQLPPGAPAAVCATTAGELHELGALACAVAAASAGVEVTWLGAGIPVQEIGEAAARRSASLVLLSYTRRVRPRALEAELRLLHAQLGGGVRILAGGSGLSGQRYPASLPAERLESVAELRRRVAKLLREGESGRAAGA
jgi:DNA-binding transcriptional MerR regulator/methylmalonyl-CoA mutase cobalamin-binding subunit